MHRLYRKFAGFHSKFKYRTTAHGFKIVIGKIYTWDSQEMKPNTIDMKPEEARRRGITRDTRSVS